MQRRPFAVWFLAAVLTGCAFHPGSAAELEPDSSGSGSGLDGGADAIGGDGSAGSDAVAVPDASIAATLTETTGNSGTATVVCSAGGAGQVDNQWYRAFRLTDFGITDAFQVTDVHMNEYLVKNTSGQPSETVTVTVYLYAGAVGATLDAAALVPANALATTTVTAPGTTSPQDFDVPITATVPAGGTFVVEVSETDQRDSSGITLTAFRVGANGAGQTQAGYWSSTRCSTTTPVAEASSALVIYVVGGH